MSVSARTEAPSDEALRDAGLVPEGRGRVLLVACGALAREILALKAANGWEHLDLQCLPAILHNTPQKIVPAIEATVAEARDRYDSIFVVYADCGTGGLLQAACEQLGVGLVEGRSLHGAHPPDASRCPGWGRPPSRDAYGPLTLP